MRVGEAKKPAGLAPLSGPPAFKSGSQLPQLSDDLPPSLNNIGKKKPMSVKFNEQFDDEFSAGEDDPESPNEANNEDDEDEDDDDDGDFDANALLNLGGYQ